MEKEPKQIDKFAHLSHLRHDFSDEMPSKIILSDADNNRFKVRKGWFFGVTATIDGMLDENLLSTRLQIEAAESLLERFISDEWKDQKLTTPENIKVANALIDVILGEEIENE